VDFFEPDVLVEAVPGMAEKLGWKGKDHVLGLPRIVPLDAFYEKDYRGRTEFAAGIHILDVMQRLYDGEYKYERRHRMPFALIESTDGNAFFDVVGGRYPSDEALDYITRAYQEVFDPETLPATFATAQKIMQERYAGPLWITRHALKESLGRGSISDETFYIFDPTDAGDVIDYWNFRLVERHAIPTSLEWFLQQRDHIRERSSRCIDRYRATHLEPNSIHAYSSPARYPTSGLLTLPASISAACRKCLSFHRAILLCGRPLALAASGAKQRYWPQGKQSHLTRRQVRSGISRFQLRHPHS
jgi:hypothetical protein